MAFQGFIKSVRLRSRVFTRPLRGILWTLLRTLNVILALLIIGVVIYGLGFQQEGHMPEALRWFQWAYAFFYAEFFFDVLTEGMRLEPRKIWYLKLTFLLLMTFIAIVWMLPHDVVETFDILIYAHNIYLVFAIVIAQAIIKISAFITQSLQSYLNPTAIFVGSFALLCLIGAGLLMLPRCTTQPIRFLDALFTSVSAVCVAGLTTLDISSSFTMMGNGIIALLIQIGGVGIMTFTSFFGLFFAGSRSSQNKMMIKDMVDPEKGASQIFSTLLYIISITLSMELLGAVGLFLSTGGQTWHDFAVALFHAISAFCNCGLSTISGGMYSPELRSNIPYQLIVCVLVIVGGLGFPIIFNLIKWRWHVFCNFARRLSGKQHSYMHIPHLVTSNTLIVLVVTTILLFGGTAVFYITERHNLLADMDWPNRIMTAFFMSVTTRSAGFNTFEMTDLMPLTLVWMMLFMWIGASPMSTGGGIKTTTFGIAFLNIWNTLRGRNGIEIRHRRIASSTVNRAFIIIFGSLVLMITGLMLLMWFEPEQPFMALLFETVSATTIGGMSLNLTAQLCDASRVVLLCLMFAGRVGIINLLACLIKEKRFFNYQYPSESIPIN